MSPRLVGVLACSVLVACSGGGATDVHPDPASAAPTADPSAAPSAPTAPEPSAPSPTPTAEPEVTPVVAPLSSIADAERVRTRWVAELDVEDVTLAGGLVHTVRVLHPDRALRDRLNTMIAADSIESFDSKRHSLPEDVELYGTQCDALAATRALVSLRCTTSWLRPVRGADGELAVDVAHYALVAGEVHAIGLGDVLLPSVDVAALEASALERAVREGEDGDEEYGWQPSWQRTTAALTTHGIFFEWIDSGYVSRSVDTELPYASLVDQLRAESPVARMLRLAPTEPSADAPVAAAVEGAGPWTVGALAPFGELGQRWSSLPAGLRGGVAIALDRTGQGRLVIRPEVGVEAARDIARALGGSLAPLPGDVVGSRPLTPTIVRATASLNVRASGEATGTWLATLPRGATVVALPDEASSARWLRVALGPSIAGYASSQHLAEERCFPALDDPRGVVPEDLRDAPSLLRVHAEAIVEGRVVPAVLLIAADARRSWISLRRLSLASCRAGAELGSWRVAARVVDAAVTRTAQRGGETLVLVAQETGDSSRATWMALRVGTEAPVWSREGLAHPAAEGPRVRAPARRGPSGRGWWPLAIETRREPIVPLRWDESTLVVDAP